MDNNKVIITVVGKDTTGIIARVCTFLAEANINIMDISQTIVQGYFNMMMVADLANTDKSFEAVVTGLNVIGQQLGVQIKCQREAIFEMMHRV